MVFVWFQYFDRRVCPVTCNVLFGRVLSSTVTVSESYDRSIPLKNSISKTAYATQGHLAQDACPQQDYDEG
jgi:hypothetical protein